MELMTSNIEGREIHRGFSAAYAALLIVALPGCAVNSPVDIPEPTPSLVQSETCATPGPISTEAIVRVATDDGADGSGIVVDQNRVITAAHVIEDGNVTLVWVDARGKRDPGHGSPICRSGVHAYYSGLF